MLDNVIFKNHLGETLTSVSDKFYINYNDLRDYEWKYNENNGKITGFYKGIGKKTIPIVIICDNDEQAWNLKDRILSVAEKDVLAKKPGRFVINGYYLEGYIVENKKSNYLISHRVTNESLVFVTDRLFWCREKTYSFKANTDAIVDAEQKEEIKSVLDNASITPDYPWDYKRDFKTKYRPITKKRVRDYKYDFHHNHTIGKLDNDHYATSDFKMIVYGPCTKPFIQIGGHIYEVFTTLYDGEYMVIDSRSRTIKKYTRYGVEENILGSRSREHYIFEKIPPGKLTVKWNAQYPFDVILYQERSEPPWRLS